MAVDKEIDIGNKLVDDRKLEEALIHFDNALKENPQAFKAHYSKSIALQRLKDYEGALVSLTHAKQIAIKRGKKELIANVLFRFATLHFTRGDIALASKFLTTSLEYGHDPKEVDLWRSQIKNKAAKLKIQYNVEDKFNSLDELPKVDVPALTIKKIEEIVEDDKKITKEVEKISIEEQKKELEEKMKNKDNLYPKTKDIRRDWFQSNDSVTVSIFIKNLPTGEKLKVQLLKRSIAIEFPTSPSSDFQYEIGPLFSSINIEESSYRVFSTKIEFYLAKETSGKWKDLESTGAQEELVTACPSGEKPESSSLQYPSSSKKNIDWNKLTIEDDAEPEGSAENEFFQKIYKDADEDTKRAMMKSYVESNGTALSTNWSEVSKKTFETTPPDGLEAKKW